MSPKRAKAKAKPRAAALHRPAAAVLRRPALRGEPGPVEAGEKTVDTDFLAGKEVELCQVAPESLQVGSRLIIEKGNYFGGDCSLSGQIQELMFKGNGRWMSMQLCGTKNEELLKYGTSTPGKRIELHLCNDRCSAEPHSPGLVHCRRGRLSLPGEEKNLSWECNMETVVEDELARLRALQPPAVPPEELGRKAKKKEKSSSSSRTRKKKGKKKKKKKEEEKKEDRKKGKSPEKDGGEEKSEERQKRKYGGRTVAQKDPKLLFAGTGLDPRPRGRQKVSRYVKKKMRKRRSSSSSSSRSEDDEEDSLRSSEEAEEGVLDQSRIRAMHRFGPGQLAAIGIKQMRTALVEVEGIWAKEDQGLPPVALRYVRSQMSPRMSGASLKEAMTIASSADLLLQGRASEAMDYLLQRLKALERISQGATWQSAERLELAPGQAPQISSRAELHAAQKEMKLDVSVRPGGTSPGGKQGSGGKGKKGKQEEKGNGKGKKKGDGGKGAATPAA